MAKTSSEILTGRQVQARYHKSAVTLWRWVRDEELSFPRPLRINGHNYWKLADLQAWEATLSGKTST